MKLINRTLIVFLSLLVSMASFTGGAFDYGDSLEGLGTGIHLDLDSPLPFSIDSCFELNDDDESSVLTVSNHFSYGFDIQSKSNLFAQNNASQFRLGNQNNPEFSVIPCKLEFPSVQSVRELHSGVQIDRPWFISTSTSSTHRLLGWKDSNSIYRTLSISH